MESQKKQALVVALRLLAATPKSRKHLYDKLLEKGFPQEVANETLADLEKQGLLSDQKLAQNLASKLTHGKPSGQRKISFELKRKGIPKKIQEEIMSGLDPEVERQNARELCQSRMERFKNLPEDKRKKRVYDFLIRRGFDFQLVRDIVEEVEMSQNENG